MLVCHTGPLQLKTILPSADHATQDLIRLLSGVVICDRRNSPFGLRDVDDDDDDIKLLTNMK